MKTLFLWCEPDGDIVDFYILDGDYSHLDGVIINSCTDEDKQEELFSLFYDDEGLSLNRPKASRTEVIQTIREHSVIIIKCGMYW